MTKTQATAPITYLARQAFTTTHEQQRGMPFYAQRCTAVPSTCYYEVLLLL